MPEKWKGRERHRHDAAAQIVNAHSRQRACSENDEAAASCAHQGEACRGRRRQARQVDQVVGIRQGRRDTGRRGRAQRTSHSHNIRISGAVTFASALERCGCDHGYGTILAAPMTKRDKCPAMSQMSHAALEERASSARVHSQAALSASSGRRRWISASCSASPKA